MNEFTSYSELRCILRFKKKNLAKIDFRFFHMRWCKAFNCAKEFVCTNSLIKKGKMMLLSRWYLDLSSQDINDIYFVFPFRLRKWTYMQRVFLRCPDSPSISSRGPCGLIWAVSGAQIARQFAAGAHVGYLGCTWANVVSG